MVITYKGYEMRSLAERRWARLFDVFGIHWVYEPKVYQTDAGGYLPDFYFPIAGVFAEVKGPKPSQDEIDKAEALERLTGMPVVFLYGRMEILGGELFHGTIEWRHMRYSTGELSEAVIDAGMPDLSIKMAECADEHDASAKHVGEILTELLDGMLGRQSMEQRKRALNKPINDKRLSEYIVKSRADHVLCEFALRAAKVMGHA